MARRRRNPTLFGVDVVDAVWMSLGAGATAWVNDQVIAPVFKRIVPSLYQKELIAKLVDSLTTFGSAYIVGALVGLLSGRIGDLMHVGGGVLAGARLVTVVVPNFQLSAKTPLEAIKLPSFFAPPVQQPPAQQQQALPQAGGAATAASQVMAGVKNMGF